MLLAACFIPVVDGGVEGYSGTAQLASSRVNPLRLKRTAKWLVVCNGRSPGTQAGGAFELKRLINVVW
jgi:hypothetical protein